MAKGRTSARSASGFSSYERYVLGARHTRTFVDRVTGELKYLLPAHEANWHLETPSQWINDADLTEYQVQVLRARGDRPIDFYVLDEKGHERSVPHDTNGEVYWYVSRLPPENPPIELPPPAEPTPAPPVKPMRYPPPPIQSRVVTSRHGLTLVQASAAQWIVLDLDKPVPKGTRVPREVAATVKTDLRPGGGHGAQWIYPATETGRAAYERDKAIHGGDPGYEGASAARGSYDMRTHGKARPGVARTLEVRASGRNAPIGDPVRRALGYLKRAWCAGGGRVKT